MKTSKLLLLVSLTVTARLFAGDVVVFAKDDSQILDSSAQTQSKDAANAAFLAAAKSDFASRALYDADFPLINPPAWGRVVSPDTTGRLQIRRSFPNGFLFHLDMDHLVAGHTYVLCINGRPEHPGNELLPESVPGHEAEKYYDFYTVTTDGQGSYHAGFALLLRPGPYNVHFYVKDTTDHKIVLYGLEYFDFEVK
jgi:hypothetical protein